ncbi:hypothetical protein D3C85_1849460 [compost metagenome]
MTVPPRKAPKALAMFRAEWFSEDASEAAPGAASRSLVCKAGVSMEPMPPTTKAITNADHAQWAAMA